MSIICKHYNTSEVECGVCYPCVTTQLRAELAATEALVDALNAQRATDADRLTALEGEWVERGRKFNVQFQRAEQAEARAKELEAERGSESRWAKQYSDQLDAVFAACAEALPALREVREAHYGDQEDAEHVQRMKDTGASCLCVTCRVFRALGMIEALGPLDVWTHGPAAGHIKAEVAAATILSLKAKLAEVKDLHDAAAAERDALKVELARQDSDRCGLEADLQTWTGVSVVDGLRDAVREVADQNLALKAQVERLTAALYGVMGQQHVLKHTLGFVGRWGDDPTFLDSEQRKAEVKRVEEAITEWHRRLVEAVNPEALKEMQP